MFSKIKQFVISVMLGASILAHDGVGAWKEFLADQKAQTGTIMTIVTGSITVLLGVIIFVNVRHAKSKRGDINEIRRLYLRNAGSGRRCGKHNDGFGEYDFLQCDWPSRNRLPGVKFCKSCKTDFRAHKQLYLFWPLWADYEEQEAGAIKRTLFAPSFIQ